jgi:hypothetical protein
MPSRLWMDWANELVLSRTIKNSRPAVRRIEIPLPDRILGENGGALWELFSSNGQVTPLAPRVFSSRIAAHRNLQPR